VIGNTLLLFAVCFWLL